MSEYISKEELKDYLEKNISFGGTEKKFRFYDIIDSLPPADVRPNIHGHWKKVEKGITAGEFSHLFKCSCCNCELYDDEFNFCPNCGADMREPKADDLSAIFEGVDSFSEADKEKMKSWNVEPKGEKGTE